MRWKNGTTQEDLAKAVRSSVDQIERFEIGLDRVPAQLLWRIAGEFRVEVKVFYPLNGDEDPADVKAISDLADLLSNREVDRLARAYYSLSKEERRNLYLSAKRPRRPE